MKRFLFSVCILGTFLLTGCGIHNKIIDDLYLISAIGYDYVGENKILGTFIIPSFQEDKTIKTIMFSKVSELQQENSMILTTEGQLPFAFGKIEVILFDEELAKRGLKEYEDLFIRNPSVGSRVMVAVVKGSTKEVLSREYWDQDSGIYLSNMFEQNMKGGTIPKTNLHLFSYALHSKGEDPFLPLLTVGEMVEINEIALFDDDKYVGSIPFDQTFTFKLLVENVNTGKFTLEAKDGKPGAGIGNIKSKRKIKVEGSLTEPTIKIKVDIACSLREYHGEIVTKKVIKELENRFKEKIEKQANDIIKKTQELNIDSLALGSKYRTKYRKYTEKGWKEKYPNLKIIPEIHVNIREIGIRK